MALTFDDRQIRKLENALEILSAKGFPMATRDTLNMTVANARKTGQRLADERLVIKGSKRNNPAMRGIQFEQTKSLDVQRQRASVGHVAEWWPLPEFGGTETKRTKVGIAIPTGAAAGQYGANKRTKQVVSRNRMRSIAFKKNKGRKAANRKQANLFAIQDAVLDGSRLAYLDLGRRKGIFRIKGGRKKFTRGLPTGAQIEMLYDLSETSVRIPAHNIITDAAKRQEKFLIENYQRALERNIKMVQRKARLR